MEGVDRRAVLAAVAGSVAVTVPGCIAGDSDGSDGSESNDSSVDADDGTDGGGSAAGDGAAGLSGSLERALGYVHRPADDEPGAELPLRVERPTALADGSAPAAGPVDPDAIDWAVAIDRAGADRPRSVAVGDFADVSPASAPNVDPAGEVRSLASYEFRNWLLAVDDDRLMLGDRGWIERVLDRHATGEPGVLDRNPSLPGLLRAAGVHEAGRGWVVVAPDRWTQSPNVDPDALAYTPGSPDGGPRPTIAYRFADGYDEGTVANLRSAFADEFDLVGGDAVSVDERGQTVVLEAASAE